MKKWTSSKDGLDISTSSPAVRFATRLIERAIDDGMMAIDFIPPSFGVKPQLRAKFKDGRTIGDLYPDLYDSGLFEAAGRIIFSAGRTEEVSTTNGMMLVSEVIMRRFDKRLSAEISIEVNSSNDAIARLNEVANLMESPHLVATTSPTTSAKPFLTIRISAAEMASVSKLDFEKDTPRD